MQTHLTKRLAIGALAGLSLLACSPAEAVYRTDDNDTGIQRLDYIENQKRNARENRLDEDQKQLQREAAELRAQRKTPLDPNKPAPAMFEGDELFYDMKTGDVFATGHVKVTQDEGRRLLSDEAKGNLKTQDVYVEDRAKLMQLVSGKTKLRLDGWHLNYNYGKKTGTMYSAAGKAGSHYIKGEKIELFPDRVLVTKGVATKCGAKKPDYNWKAEKIEIFPEDVMILHNASFYIKGVRVFHKKRYVVDISGTQEQPRMPRVGYDDEDGWWISDEIKIPVARRLEWANYLKFMSHQKFKGYSELKWNNSHGSERIKYSLLYGYLEDSDDRWLKKEPSFTYEYGNRICKQLPLSYSLNYEVGRWYQSFRDGRRPSIRSTHRYYYAGISHDPIIFFKDFRLFLSAGYAITKETYNGGSTVKGFNWNALLMKDISPAVTAYTGYYYTAQNTANSVFSYDLDSYSRKLEYGLSVKVSPRDRLVMGQYYDLSTKRQRKIEYYWFHDMHCAQMIFRYRIDRDKARNRNTWHLTFQFTPW